MGPPDKKRQARSFAWNSKQAAIVNRRLKDPRIRVVPLKYRQPYGLHISGVSYWKLDRIAAVVSEMLNRENHSEDLAWYEANVEKVI